MTENELYEVVFQSKMFKRWHWFRWHFEHRLRGDQHPFATAIVTAALECDVHLPGFAKKLMVSLADISGKEKYEPHYEQLLQKLAELHVIRQIVTFPWKQKVAFIHEPTTSESKMNPELLVSGERFSVGVEVKAPSLLDHIRLRDLNATQLASRLPENVLEKLLRPGESVTKPRDNPVKDFLLNADLKFSHFRTLNPAFRGMLVIVWDDHIYEPISALLGPTMGLLTENSYYRDAAGSPVRFENVDAIILIRHWHQLRHATRDEPFRDNCRGAFDYGKDGDFPPKAFIANPNGRGMLTALVDCLHAYTPCPEMGAEYRPQDLIWWI